MLPLRSLVPALLGTMITLACDSSLPDPLPRVLTWRVDAANYSLEIAALDMAIDQDGSRYLAAAWSGDLTLDPTKPQERMTGEFESSSGFEHPQIHHRSVARWKVDRNGNQVWARATGSTAALWGIGIVADHDGATYLIGSGPPADDKYLSSADVPAGFYLATSWAMYTRMDGYIEKYDPDGLRLWRLDLPGIWFNGPNAAALTPEGHLVVAGQFADVVDFDPGPGTVERTAVWGEDAFVLELTRNGDYRSVATFGGLGEDGVESLAIDAQGNRYLAGDFQDVVDFDPGEGIVARAAKPLDPNDYTYYDPDDNTVERDYFVVSLTPANTLRWAGVLSGKIGRPKIAVTSQGALYLAAGVTGQTDLDPTSGRAIFPCPDGSVACIKLESTGDFTWGRIWEGAHDEPGDLVATSDGGVIVQGHSENGFDANPATGVDGVSEGDWIIRLADDGAYRGAATWEATDRWRDPNPSLVVSPHGLLYAFGGVRDFHDVDFDTSPERSAIHELEEDMGLLFLLTFATTPHAPAATDGWPANQLLDTPGDERRDSAITPKIETTPNATLDVPYPVADPSPVIHGLDPSFHADILQQLHRHTGDITRADLASLTMISSHDGNASTLEGLQYATSLEQLTVYGGTVLDLTPLAACANLKSLHLSNTLVEDLSPLRGLQRLEDLWIDGTLVADLGPLAGKPLLRQVWAEGTPIASLAPLAACPRLKSLNIQRTAVTDLTPLRGSPVESLFLGGTQITTLEPLGTCAALSDLYIIGAPVTSLAPLAACRSLRWLDVVSAPITDLAPLSGLPNLIALRLTEVPVSDATPLASLPWLEYLTVRQTRITDATPMLGLLKLGSFDTDVPLTAAQKQALAARGVPIFP